MAKDKIRKRKRLEDLSTDEFLQFGLDSGESDDDTGKTSHVKTKPKQKASTEPPSTTPTHKDQLEGLKEKDPEFYKFLQENDEKLLEFDESDASDLGSDDDDAGEDDLDGVKSEEEDDEAAAVAPKKKKKLTVDGEHERTEVTLTMIKEWKSKLQPSTEGSNPIKALRQVMTAFHCGVIDLSAHIDADKPCVEDLPYRVSSQAFNSVTRLCLEEAYRVLSAALKLDKRKKVKGRLPLPSTTQHWSSVKTFLKTYLYDILQLLRQLMDANMLAVVLKHAKQLSLFYACFPRIAKMYLKRLVRMWSSEEELVRVVSLLCIRQVTLLMPNLYEFVVKLMYITYVKSSKFINANSKPLVAFMRNSLVEIFALDVSATYQIAFVYVRQLAIHLRTALSTKKDSTLAVYNWQYISCIQLWCRVLGELHCDTTKSLIYPLVQITLGVIRLVPSARYYPLRFHCIRSLIALAKATDTYIPVSPYLTEILEAAEFTKMPKPSTSKPSDFAVALKIPKSELHTKAFLESVVNTVYDLLLEHFASVSCSIGFPELVFPTSVRMKRFVKRAKVQKFSKQMKQLNDKLQEAATEMVARRSTVNFSPKDLKDVEKWENQVRSDGNKLMTFFESWRKTQNTIAAQQSHHDSGDDEDNGDKDADNSDDDEERQEKERKKAKPKQPKPKKKEQKRQMETKAKLPSSSSSLLSLDDSVQDLIFSDSD